MSRPDISSLQNPFTSFRIMAQSEIPRGWLYINIGELSIDGDARIRIASAAQISDITQSL